jgi:hypothetical protein
MQNSSMKLQSAMEYLMTYGWAILIIAIVLLTLNFLGVFNPQTYAVKAQPGSCSVNRPGGPNTTTGISLVGQCGSFAPKFAIYYSPSNPYATIGIPSLTPVLAAQNTITITAWIDPSIPQSVSCSNPTTGNPCMGWIFAQYADYGLATCQVSASTIELCYYYWSAPGYGVDQGYTVLDPSAILQQNTWYFVSAVINDPWHYSSTTGTETLYLNGVNTFSGGVVNSGAKAWITDIAGGSYVCCGQSFEGAMSNVQLYNTLLSANSIQALYQEGIGGPPIDLQDLEGWWPLNGNPNDYSGQNWQVTSGNVFYTTGWEQGYTSP